jgi:hypothetical protein
MIPLTGESMLLQGRALAGLEQPEEAGKAFRQSLAFAAASGTLNLQWQALSELAALDAAAGDGEAAAQHRAAARETILRLAEGLSDPGLRQSFLGQAAVKEVLEKAGEVSP